MKKRIILVSIDTLRYDCVGYQPEKKELKNNGVLDLLDTPNLDEIAKKSLCFMQAISTSTYTTSAHASILTGLNPPKHGVRAFYDTKLSDKVLSMAEIFKKSGYITVFATDIIELFEPLDLTRGFSHIFMKQDKELYNFLEENKEENVFLFVHFFDVHEPYLLSDYEIYDGYNTDFYEMIKFLSKKNNVILDNTIKKPYELWKVLRSKIGNNIDSFLPFYVKGVTKFDKGRFKEFMSQLKRLRFINDSLLMIFSDHGEGRCIEDDQNIFSHAGFPFENVIRVPLMVFSDEIKPGVVDTQVSLIDLFPTALEIAMNKKPEDLLTYAIDGKSLISNNELKNRVHVHGEIWSSNFNFCATDQGLTTPDKGLEWILKYRFLRLKHKKYIIYGKTDDSLPAAAFELSNEEFIKELYHFLLCRTEDPMGFEYYLKNLNLNILSRKDTLNSFLQSDEYKLRKKFVMYDLENDPDEMKPIDPLKDPLLSIEYFKNLDFINSLEKQAIRSEKIFGAKLEADLNEKDNELYIKEDEKKIKDRLKSLGYFTK